MTDIEIAQNCEMKPILEIAKVAHVDEKYIEQYGNYKAKIDLSYLKNNKKILCVSKKNCNFVAFLIIQT